MYSVAQQLIKISEDNFLFSLMVYKDMHNIAFYTYIHLCSLLTVAAVHGISAWKSKADNNQ